MTPPDATAPLLALLDAPDPDALLAARAAIESLDEDDDETVRAVLNRWGDERAVANLLMFPDVIPDDVRLVALVRGLREPTDSYLPLAAAVGLQHLAEAGDVPGVARPVIVEGLVRLVQRTTGPTAGRASATLKLYAGPDELPSIAPLLGHADDTARHNVLSTVLRLVGVTGLGPLLVESVASGALRRSAAERVERMLQAEGIDVDDPEPGQRRLRETSLATTRLAYVPGYDEW